MNQSTKSSCEVCGKHCKEYYLVSTPAGDRFLCGECAPLHHVKTTGGKVVMKPVVDQQVIARSRNFSFYGKNRL